MTAHKILIVEDEENIAEVLIAYSHQQGYTTEHFSSGKGVVDFVKHNHVSLILLDLMLPVVDGITICQQLREFTNVPIIMITAKREEVDTLLGLDIGADDYICKPFSPKEVMSRVNAVLRRTAPSQPDSGHQSGFEIQKDGYVTLLNGQNLSLTAVEFKIFALFFEHANRVFSREDIINRVYTESLEMSDRSVDNHIKNIRKKINDVEKGLNPITAVYGVGYKFSR
jgi:two-component system response regulator BaeR